MEAFIRGCGLDPQSYVGFLQFQIIDFVMHGLPFLTSMIQLSQKTLFSSYEILTIFTTCATSLAVHFGWALLYAGDLDLTHVYCPDLVMQESKSRPAWNAMWFVAFLGHFFPVATFLLLNWWRWATVWTAEDVSGRWCQIISKHYNWVIERWGNYQL